MVSGKKRVFRDDVLTLARGFLCVGVGHEQTGAAFLRFKIGKPLQIVRDGGKQGEIGFGVICVIERILGKQKQKLALGSGGGRKRLLIKRVIRAFQIQRQGGGKQVEGITVLLV